MVNTLIRTSQAKGKPSETTGRTRPDALGIKDAVL